MTKQLPNLQVALDHSDLQGAITAAVSVGHMPTYSGTTKLFNADA